MLIRNNYRFREEIIIKFFEILNIITNKKINIKFKHKIEE